MTLVRKVICAMSGGVDSTVAAYLMLRRGYEVHGVFMKNWDISDETGFCMAVQDAEDCEWVCKKMGIKFSHLNFVKDYWNEVFSLLRDYENGFTPNPDIMCNKKIKFGVFFDHVLEKFGGDALVTGHYARSSFGDHLENYNPVKGAYLLKAVDTFKDQTFFLSQISQKSLQKTIFPLGGLTKDLVKKIALDASMDRIAKKKESMGICFIGTRHFQNFISEYIDAKVGKFMDVDTGKVIADHSGIHQWTVGQNCKIGGQLNPYYVMSKDVATQTIWVASGSNHPSLFTDLFYTTYPHWICRQPEPLSVGKILECEFRFQHTKPLTKCFVSVSPEDKRLVVQLNEPLRAITPGQYAVFYQGAKCLGSARINHLGPSLHVLGIPSPRSDSLNSSVSDRLNRIEESN